MVYMQTPEAVLFLGLENRKSKELHGRDSVIASANGAGEAGPVAFSDVAPSSAQVGPGRCNSDLGGRSVPVELPILPKRVAENVGQFTGRAWLLPKILEWWDEGDERLFLLTGGPGTGKSMILAWLAGFGPDPEDPGARRSCSACARWTKRCNFVRHGPQHHPQAFAENIANQLTHTVPGFRDALAATLADRVSIVYRSSGDNLRQHA